MKKIYTTLVLILIMLWHVAPAQNQTYTPSKSNLEARKWFNEARFGLFIHWGISSYLCNGEWVMENEKISFSNYHRLLPFYNPSEFDPTAWVSLAKAAGMKYITFTTRHHDGFSNWDTKQSDWKITSTPYKKDVLKMLADECAKQNIKLVLYYSTLDWSRDDYQWETGRTGQHAGRKNQSDWPSYIRFMKAQLTELLTEYGPIAGIWFDGHWDQTSDENRTDHKAAVDWRYNEIYSHIHQLQAQCLIGNNHHLPPFPGEDFQMFERDLPGENKSGFSGQAVSKLPLEMCQTIGSAWGFKIKDTAFKSTTELIQLLVKAAGNSSNLLLNIGPMPNGVIQPEFIDRLEQIGAWTGMFGESIYGTNSFLKPQSWGTITKKDQKYYVHILDPNSVKEIQFDFPNKPKSLRWLTSTRKADWKYDNKSKKLQLTIHPSDEPSHPILLIETSK